MRRLALAVSILLATVVAGCSDDGGSEGSFCDEVRSLPSLEAVLNRFSEADPAALEERIDQAREAYRDLAAAAPSEVAEAAEDVVAVVEDILTAVEDHPDDPNAAAAQLRDAMDDHPGAESARAEMAAFAEDRCDVELDPTLSGTAPDGDVTTTSASPAGEPTSTEPTTTDGGG